MKSVLVFGAGLVAKPLVRYLLDHGFQVTVASRTISKAEGLIGDHPQGKALAFDITKDNASLGDLVAQADGTADWTLHTGCFEAPQDARMVRFEIDMKPSEVPSRIWIDTNRMIEADRINL